MNPGELKIEIRKQMSLPDTELGQAFNEGMQQAIIIIDQYFGRLEKPVMQKIADKKRKLKVIINQQQFEEFTNSGIEIIDIDVKATEQSFICQDSFVAVIQYYDSNFTA